MRVAIIARIKQSVVDNHRSAQQAAAAAGRSVHKRGPINIRAARIMTSQEIAAQPPVKRPRSSQEEETQIPMTMRRYACRHASPSVPLLS